MGVPHNRLKITADEKAKTVTLVTERRTTYGPADRRQFTMTKREFDRAITEARIAVPWKDLR